MTYTKIRNLTIALLLVAWEAIVLSLLWKWFMTGALGVPPLSVPAAMGIIVTIRQLVIATVNGQASKYDSSDDIPDIALDRAVKCLIGLGLGFLISLAM